MEIKEKTTQGTGIGLEDFLAKLPAEEQENVEKVVVLAEAL